MQCPTCNKEVQYEGNPYRPFCSERCKLIDLGQWAAEKFRIPTKETLPDQTSNGNGEDED